MLQDGSPILVMIRNLFPSRLLIKECKDYSTISHSLQSWFYSYQSKHSYSHDYTMIKGWQSDVLLPSAVPDLDFFWPFFYSHLDECFNEYGFDTDRVGYELCAIVFNINTPGSLQSQHSHPEAHMSGTFYVSTPEYDAGHLCFHNAHTFHEATMIKALREDVIQQEYVACNHFVYPREGYMTMFPSHLEHSVKENRSSKNRLSIGYNIKVVFK